jgi:DNA-binding MarR family transcriptional regulator
VDEYRRAAQFRLALNRFLGSADNAVRAVGLTPQRYLMLLAIKGSRGGGLTISDLADLLGSAQSTVTELVDRSEAAGLVRRGGSNDGRVVVVAATPDGDRLFRKAFAAVRDDRERLMAHLNDPESDERAP